MKRFGKLFSRRLEEGGRREEEEVREVFNGASREISSWSFSRVEGKEKENSIATTPSKGEAWRRRFKRRRRKGGREGGKSEIDEALDPASSRMTIISGHWVDGAWRLSFAPYSYACPSCLSKPSLF